MAKLGKHSVYQILEAQLSSRSFSLSGHELSPDDTIRVANALSLWILVVGDLGKCYGLERCYSLANMQRCASQLTGIDIGNLHCQLKKMLELLRLWQPHQGCHSWKAYKAYWSEVINPQCTTFDLLWPMLSKGYPEFSTSWFRDINTILQFWSRLTLQDVDWILDENLEQYITLEKEMSEWDYPSFLISGLREIIMKWMETFPTDIGRPVHSNGATNEVSRGKGIEYKMRVCYETYSGRRLLYEACGYQSHPLIRGEVLFTRTRREVWSRWDNVAKVEFVPKGIDKKRVISEEATYHQFLQSIYAQRMALWFEKTPDIRVDLKDQGKSRDLCLRGSRTMHYATFDLSSASDTVTYQLTKQLIVGTPLQPILLVRTSWAELPDGSLCKLNKFLPMGSILCFPIECMVFSACCRLACNLSGCAPDYRVYGDDIIIPEEAVAWLRAILQLLHFKLNEEKSYGPYSAFLEACGMEAFLGEDVSPCRLSRRWDIVKLRNGKSPESVEGGISVCNRLWDYGLYRARRAVIAELMCVAHVAFSVDPEKGIYHPDPSNQHLRWRFNRDYQCAEFNHFVSGVKVGRGTDFYRYMLLLEEYHYTDRVALKDPLDAINVRSGTTRTKFSSTWCDQYGECTVSRESPYERACRLEKARSSRASLKRAAN